MTYATRLQTAIALAQEAGDLARQMRSTAGRATFASVKGPKDFVTAADRAVEELLKTRLLEAFPQDAFLGEETGASQTTLTGEAVTWVVDPIDGTTNFMRGLPEWGVSIACVQGGAIEVAVIALPDLSQTAWAARGKGAFLNGQKLVLETATAADSRLAIIGYSPRTELSDHQALIAGLLDNGFDYRRQGAACFGLLAVAAGWADAYFEPHLHAWDAMAGLLLVSEAGGAVEYPDMAAFLAQGGGVLACGAVPGTRAALACAMRHPQEPGPS